MTIYDLWILTARYQLFTYSCPNSWVYLYYIRKRHHIVHYTTTTYLTTSYIVHCNFFSWILSIRIHLTYPVPMLVIPYNLTSIVASNDQKVFLPFSIASLESLLPMKLVRKNAHIQWIEGNTYRNYRKPWSSHRWWGFAVTFHWNPSFLFSICLPYHCQS